MTTTFSEGKNSLNVAKILSLGSIEKEELLKTTGLKQSTFYKHLKVIKKAGFEVKNNNNVFKMQTYKRAFNYSKSDIDIFCYLLMIANIMLPKSKASIFKRAVDEFLSLSNQKETINLKEKYESYKIATLAEYYSKKIEALKEYLNKKKLVTITTKRGRELTIKPLGYEWKSDKIYLRYKNAKKEIKNITLNEIVKIVASNKEKEVFNTKDTIFELYGRLADCYLLKDNERIVESKKGALVIANNSDDKEELFKRLLKYDTLCKVIFPKSDVEIFKGMIEKSLANLNGFLDN